MKGGEHTMSTVNGTDVEALAERISERLSLSPEQILYLPRIIRVLAENNGLCMDVPKEREQLAEALLDIFKERR
jgi:hypothetical protein